VQARSSLAAAGTDRASAVHRRSLQETVDQRAVRSFRIKSDQSVVINAAYEGRTEAATATAPTNVAAPALNATAARLYLFAPVLSSSRRLPADAQTVNTECRRPLLPAADG
jgi:hypothetical protein